MSETPALWTEPRNAFARKFLRRIAERDSEPDTAGEAYANGVWRRVPHPKLGYSILPPAHGPGEPPFATFFNPYHARLAQAILPATGRSTLWRLDTKAGEHGHCVFVEGELAGYFRLFDSNVVPFLTAADVLTRNPQALAFLLEATSGPGLEHAGRHLDRALRGDGNEGGEE